MAKPYASCGEGPANYFSSQFKSSRVEALAEQSRHAKAAKLHPLLSGNRPQSLEDFAALLSPLSQEELEVLAQSSQRLTQQHFGKVIRLFAPLYLSNECVNICKYCGFSRDNDIPRITIAADRVERETRKLATQGFRNLLLVAGEHPKHVSGGYVEDCIRRCLPIMPAVSLELGPMEASDYVPLARAGAEGLVVYQETYHQPTYEKFHTAGPKRYYAWRLDTPERGAEAGFRRLGIGVLLGLHDWRYELIALAEHARYLLRRCWKSQLSLSVLRLRPSAGAWQPEQARSVSDAQFVQAICALRLFLPHAAITLSTREPAHLRNGLMRLGVTTMSAGSCTEPGGYDHFDENSWQPKKESLGQQFSIDDKRSPEAIAQMIRAAGYDPVWKDFDASLAHPV